VNKESEEATAKQQAEPLFLLLDVCSVYSSTLKMETAPSSIKMLSFYQSIWCPIAEDNILQEDRAA
jgi:hypothetical protein